MRGAAASCPEPSNAFESEVMPQGFPALFKAWQRHSGKSTARRGHMFAKIKHPHAKYEPRIAAKGEKARKTAFVCEDQIGMLQATRALFLHPSLALASARSSEAYALNLLRY